MKIMPIKPTGKGLNVLDDEWTSDPEAFIKQAILHERVEDLLEGTYIGWAVIFGKPEAAEILLKLLPGYGFADLASRLQEKAGIVKDQWEDMK